VDREQGRLGLEEAFEHLGCLGAGTSSLPYCFEHGRAPVSIFATKVGVGRHALLCDDLAGLRLLSS
jgi:hypothetical protein